MKKREVYTYENPKFYALRDPMREVVRAYWAAMQYYAAIKEVVWGRYGMAYLSDALHTMEHKQPEYIDQFSATLRQQGLEIEYPSVPELDELLDSLDEVFRICIELNDNVDKALQRFIDVADRKENEVGGVPNQNQGRFPGLARQVESLQIENSKDRKKLLESWSMWDNDVSRSSFDKWIKSIYDLPDNGEEDDV